MRNNKIEDVSCYRPDSFSTFGHKVEFVLCLAPSQHKKFFALPDFSWNSMVPQPEREKICFCIIFCFSSSVQHCVPELDEERKRFHERLRQFLKKYCILIQIWSIFSSPIALDRAFFFAFFLTSKLSGMIYLSSRCIIIRFVQPISDDKNLSLRSSDRDIFRKKWDIPAIFQGWSIVLIRQAHKMQFVVDSRAFEISLFDSQTTTVTYIFSTWDLINNNRESPEDGLELF